MIILNSLSASSPISYFSNSLQMVTETSLISLGGDHVFLIPHDLCILVFMSLNLKDLTPFLIITH